MNLKMFFNDGKTVCHEKGVVIFKIKSRTIEVYNAVLNAVRIFLFVCDQLCLYLCFLMQVDEMMSTWRTDLVVRFHL